MSADDHICPSGAARHYDDKSCLLQYLLPETLCMPAGWGGPPRQVEAGPARPRGGRGGRGRRGRGRGNRRGGRSGRRGSRGFDDDGSGSESDFPASLAGDVATLDPLAAAPVKLAVEQIYGWRWPTREEEVPLK